MYSSAYPSLFQTYYWTADYPVLTVAAVVSVSSEICVVQLAV